MMEGIFEEEFKHEVLLKEKCHHEGFILAAKNSTDL